MELIEGLRRNSVHHPSGRIGILTELAATAVMAVSTPRFVVDTVKPWIRTLEAASQHHFALYAVETHAAALARCNFMDEARIKLRLSRRIRGQIGITYSAWDARRLAPLTPL